MGNRGRQGQVFVDATGRRKRIVRYAAIGTGAVFVCFLTALTAGLFGSGPGGGPLPWVPDKETRSPAAADPSASAGPAKEPSAPVLPVADTGSKPSASATSTAAPTATATAGSSPDASPPPASATSTVPGRGNKGGNGNGVTPTSRKGSDR